MKTGQKFFKGLQGKLLLYFLLMSLVPLLVVSTVSYQKAQTALQNTTRDMLMDMASIIEAKVDTTVGDRFDDIKAWAAMPDLIEAVKDKKYEEVSSELAALAKAYDVYKLVMVLDAEGNLVAASDPAILADRSVDRNQASREWFKKAMAGEVFVEDVGYSSTVKENVIGFSAPIKANGAVIGVISSRMSWEIVQKMVEEQKDGATGHAFILNSEGVIIAHPKKDKVLKENLAKSSDPLMVAFVQKLAKGEEAFADVTVDGVDLEIQGIPSRGSGDFKGVGWKYAMAMADDEIYAPIAALRLMVTILIAITVVIVAVLAVTVARAIAGPMVRGVAFAQAVAAGDLTQTLEVRSRDEVGQLADALNSMVQGLKGLVGRIKETSGDVASAAGQITAGSGQLTRAAHSQASAAEETSSTMVQMAASIQTVAQNADSLATNVDEVSSSIQELGASSEQVSRSSELMASSVTETSATIEQMTVSIEKVAQNAEDLASSVTETSTTVEQMTVSIDQVAGNAQELQQVATDTASIVEEMAVSIRQVAKNVEEADAVARAAAKEGAAGQQSVQDALVAMQRVGEVIDLTASSIVNLGKRSEEIGSIVQVINEIADQTNLLALNAAIEAARAGDAGRGFAVVADEVRKLAERSVSATKEIGQVIKQVQADTTASVKYGEQATQEARASMALSAEAGNALVNIVKGIEQTSSLMSQVAVMTGEQASASTQVIKAVEKMNQATAVVANASREQALGGRQIRIAVERMNKVTQEVTAATREQAQGGKQIRIAVENMNQVTQQVNIATREQALSARQIVESVNKMNSMTQSVANATAEQKKGGEMVVTAVENISDLTRENLTAVEQLSSSAERLSHQAEELSQMVTQFKV